MEVFLKALSEIGVGLGVGLLFVYVIKLYFDYRKKDDRNIIDIRENTNKLLQEAGWLSDNKREIGESFNHIKRAEEESIGVRKDMQSLTVQIVKTNVIISEKMDRHIELVETQNKLLSQVIKKIGTNGNGKLK